MQLKQEVVFVEREAYITLSVISRSKVGKVNIVSIFRFKYVEDDFYKVRLEFEQQFGIFLTKFGFNHY